MTTSRSMRFWTLGVGAALALGVASGAATHNSLVLWTRLHLDRQGERQAERQAEQEHSEHLALFETDAK